MSAISRCVSCAIIVALPVLGAVGAEQPEKSRFEGIAASISKVFKLTVSGSGLAFDRGTVGAEAGGEQPQPGDVAGAGGVGVNILVNVGGAASGLDKAFRELGTAAGGRGFSMSSSGTRREQSFSGTGISGRLSVDGENIQMVLREDDGAGAEFSLSDAGNGQCRLLFTNQHGDIVLLSQARDGRIVVIHASGDKTLHTKSPSFVAFYRDNADFVEREMFPLLKRMGVGLPPARFDSEVITAVCNRLRPLSNEEQAEVATLLKELDDDKYEKREAAVKALSEKFARYEAQIRDAAKRPPTEETKRNLERILAKRHSYREINEFVSAMELCSDTAYLVELLDATKADDQNRAAVVAKLEAQTGQKLGADAAAWRKWLATQVKKPAANP